MERAPWRSVTASPIIREADINGVEHGYSLSRTYIDSIEVANASRRSKSPKHHW
ncbi:hypothetical protein M378DRAFT_171575 [Amanita muscaria Koide BX008]|uniref:Uncharacterized protein n=1 Tax=Amanita muscaria (strain Koide BX008) TaxID=946122 RepID=A0A0C2SU70_AMAMK|nr:hypothetical protein M378DRAFT_171575 [Amanita muscaria Koide BX008]